MARRLIRPVAGRQLGRLHRLHPQRGLRKPPEKPRSTGRLRILYVRPADHEPVRHQNAQRLGRGR